VRRTTAWLVCPLSLLVACFKPPVLGYDNHKVMSDIQDIECAAMEYAVQNAGALPGSIEDLVRPDETGFRYLSSERIPLNPWGHAYGYEPPSKGSVQPRIVSYGSDGKPGGEGDARDFDNFMFRERFAQPAGGGQGPGVR
jgi:hypothetical protein